ncbi:C40 family peptidase [Paenibacillus marinisediminis]
MKKKFITAAVAMSLLFSIGTGSAFAATKLDTTIDGLLGIDYKYGGTTTKGFDCSGFVGYVFDKYEIDLPRTSSGMYDEGTKVKKSELRPGDLVFFNTSGKGVSHVGIYVGDNKFAHASTSKGTRIDSLSMDYYENRYVGAKRILSDEQYKYMAVE